MTSNESQQSLAERTADLADKWARIGIEATLGSPDKYWQAFKRMRLVIAAAIEEERAAQTLAVVKAENEACAKIADRAVLESYSPGCAEVATWISNEIRKRKF